MGPPFGLVLWYWGQKGRPGEMIYDDEIPSVAYSPNPLRCMVVIPHERVETLAELTDQEAKR